MPKNIVTAASGARDAYMVPLALYNAKILARHVTDFYTPDVLMAGSTFLPRSVSEKISKRHADGLPSSFVYNSRRWAGRQLLSQLVPPLGHRWQSDQDSIGMAALRHARDQESALLLYAGYAYSAFTAEPLNARPRGLVQYHPHIRESASILRADIYRYPCLSDSLDQLTRDELDQTNQPELEIADSVICCSSFTAETCTALGVDPTKIRIISYGAPTVPLPAEHRDRHGSSPCNFLFVGSGIHRKGLHHLLLAWKKANLTHSTLTIVSRRIDAQISTNFDPGLNVRYLASVDDSSLPELYERSDVFVMPSLIEGFGYVYLEAMVHGCFCIGSSNTALPDLLFGSTGLGTVVEPSNPEALADELRRAQQLALDGLLSRHAIALQASKFTWEHFRKAVVSVAKNLLA